MVGLLLNCCMWEMNLIFILEVGVEVFLRLFKGNMSLIKAFKKILGRELII